MGIRWACIGLGWKGVEEAGLAEKFFDRKCGMGPNLAREELDETCGEAFRSVRQEAFRRTAGQLRGIRGNSREKHKTRSKQRIT